MIKYGALRTLIQNRFSSVLPKFESYKVLDTVIHYKKEDEDTIFQVWTVVYDRRVEYEFSFQLAVTNIKTELLFSVFTKNEYVEKQSFTIGVYFPKELHRYYATTDAEIEVWINKAENEIEKNIEQLTKYHDKIELEKLFNYNFKNKPIEQLDINHNQIIKGLIMAKLLNEVDYLFLYDKAFKIYEYGGFVDSLIAECKELNLFLNMHSKQNLSDINYLKQLLKK